MGQLTSSIKSYRANTVTLDANGLTLDAGPYAGVSLTHRGRNLHHIIYAATTNTKTITVNYSLDGTNFFPVFTTANGDHDLYWDTGRHSVVANPAAATTALADGGGAMTCPPALVKITTETADNLSEFQVLTYGTLIR
tara:strand:- start:957 stop:1370 length:414 start_codon:yes stop_codon:yes gene_type:complete